MAIGISRQERHEWVHDHETGPYAPYALLYEREILRDGEQPVMAVFVRHGGERQYLRRVGSGGIKARPNRVRKPVFGGEQDHASRFALGAVRESLTGGHTGCQV